MTANRQYGMQRAVVLLFFVVLVLVALTFVPARAYEETQFSTVENATFNDLVYNETVTVYYPNGTPAYLLDYHPPVARTVPLGVDLDFQIKVTALVCLLVTVATNLIYAVRDLINWILNREV